MEITLQVMILILLVFILIIFDDYNIRDDEFDDE